MPPGIQSPYGRLNTLCYTPARPGAVTIGRDRGWARHGPHLGTPIGASAMSPIRGIELQPRIGWPVAVPSSRGMWMVGGAYTVYNATNWPCGPAR